METCGKCQSLVPPESWDKQCTDCDSYYTDVNIDHLLGTSLAGGHLVCLHCGGVWENNGGAFSKVSAVMYAFKCDHADCEPRESGVYLKKLMETNTAEFKSELCIRS